MREQRKDSTRSLLLAAMLVALTGAVAAKLPPPSDEAKAKADEAKAKSAWADKVGQYQLCQSMDRVAQQYRKANPKAPAAIPMPPCVKPGPYVEIAASKPQPLEGAGAHSPPGTASGPPSGKATAAEKTGKSK